MHHTGTVGLLEEETLRHMSDEKLAELKAHTEAVFEIMGKQAFPCSTSNVLCLPSSRPRRRVGDCLVRCGCSATYTLT